MELAGNIKDFSIIEISQFVWISKRTGCLRLFLETGSNRFEGSLYFVDGEITSAKADYKKGKEAFFKICESDNGSFRFISGETTPDTNIVTTMNQLLLEVSGRTKLFETLKREIPSTDIVYSLTPEFSSFDLQFESDQWNVIAHIDGQKTLSDISKDLGLPEFDAMRIFYSLLQVGVIRRVSLKQVIPEKKPKRKVSIGFIQKIIDYFKSL
jgi:hypothetical protein